MKRGLELTLRFFEVWSTCEGLVRQSSHVLSSFMVFVPFVHFRKSSFSLNFVHPEQNLVVAGADDDDEEEEATRDEEEDWKEEAGGGGAREEEEAGGA